MSLRSIQNLIKIPLFIAVMWMVLCCPTPISGSDPTQRCPLSGHSMVICQMNPMEHIQEWQSMFTMLPVQSAALALLALFALFAVFKSRLWSKTSLPDPSVLASQRFRARASNFQIFNPLQEAFSSGILNPKIF